MIFSKTGPEGLLHPDDEKINAKRAKRVKAGFFKTLKKVAIRIPFMEDLVASYYCAFDPRTPARVRGILLAALAYFVMPIDMVPDFLVGIGFTDDLAVLSFAINAVRRHLREEHYLAAKAALKDTDKS